MKKLLHLRFLSVLLCTLLGIGISSATDYQLITSADEVEAGSNYVIVVAGGSSTAESYAVQAGTTNFLDVKDMISGNTLTTTSTAIVWTAEDGTTTGCFKFKNGIKYIYCSGGNTTINSNSTNSADWKINSLGSNLFKIDLNGGRFIGWSGSKFAAYAATNFKNQIESATALAQYAGALYIYKEVTTPPSSVAAPTFTPNGGAVAKGTTVTINAEAGLCVYYASETTVGANPTNEEVFGHGTADNSFTVNADETYYAVAMNDDDEFSNVAKATFTVYQHAGTEDDPLDVADAIKIANAAGTTATTDSYYVKGYVTDGKRTHSSTTGAIGFYISDDEAFEGAQLQVYGLMKDAEDNGFTAEEAAAVAEGDLVVVYAPLKMYGTSPETTGGYLVSVTGKTDPEVEWSAAAYTWKIGVSTASELPILSNPYNVGITYASSDENVATIDANGDVTILAEGETTITATVVKNDTYKVVIASYSLTVVDPSKIEDVIDADFPGFTNTYQDNTKTSNGVTYVLYGYKNSGIQLNANSKAQSGMVVTANVNNYAVKSIVVDVKSIGNVNLLVIGSNSPYTGTTVIGDAESRAEDLGTVLETITATGKVTITPTDEYKYICICPASTAKSGTMVLNSITINWKPGSVDAKVGDTGYTTLYYGDRDLLVPSGIDGWTFTAAGSAVTATKSYTSGSVIPAGQAVVLFTTTPGTYNFALATAAGTPVECNLHGTDAAEEVTTEGTPYILGVGTHGVGFYQAAADGGKTFNNGAHKAYLEIPATIQAPARILLNLGETDGINVITVDEDDANGAMYNVLGQPVNDSYKGFVIKNGKKVINK